MYMNYIQCIYSTSDHLKPSEIVEICVKNGHCILDFIMSNSIFRIWTYPTTTLGPKDFAAFVWPCVQILPLYA